jgi:hypothetical protein
LTDASVQPPAGNLAMRALYAGLRRMQAPASLRRLPFLSPPAREAMFRAQLAAGERMKSRLAMVLTLLGLALALSACDKCGDFEGIRVPGQPHACKNAGAR